MNPNNKERSCGGSSGGDAGLVAADCVPLSVGSDIGGSIRAPSHFCGVYGFKPTSERLSLAGMMSPVPRGMCISNRIAPVVGPIA